jgi:Zn-dependent membrane protease YugP
MTVLQKIKIIGRVLMVLGIIFFATRHIFIGAALVAIGVLFYFFDKYRSKTWR